jgi:hypothetical protein
MLNTTLEKIALLEGFRFDDNTDLTAVEFNALTRGSEESRKTAAKKRVEIFKQAVRAGGIAMLSELAATKAQGQQNELEKADIARCDLEAFDLILDILCDYSAIFKHDMMVAIYRP